MTISRRYLLKTALFLLLALVAVPSSSLAQSALTDDAHVSLSQTGANHGANPNLRVSFVENIYLKFKFLPALPTNTPGSRVGRATLKLYAGRIHTAGKLDLYAVAGPWDENSITANDAPPLGQLVTNTSQIGVDQSGKFLIIDVTSVVRQWLGDDGQGTNGIPNHGLAVVAHPADATTPEVADFLIDSKENSQTSHEPQLNIQLLGASDSGLQKVEHDATLTGDGTNAAPLGVAIAGINNIHLANDSVTVEKIAAGAVTSSELADGAVTSPKITAPLSLTSADPGFTLSVGNTGAGAAITANGAINTSAQYNIGGARVLSTPGTNNLFAGAEAGAGNTTGNANAFFGKNAGQANTTGSNNSFVGLNAGAGNTTGRFNSFFGDAAGFRNAAANDNSFFGNLAGFRNTANGNSFFGSRAGFDNTTGSANAFFGSSAGTRNTTGTANSFFGILAGAGTTTGEGNSYFGSLAGVNNITGSGNSIFGNDAGFNNKSDHNSFFGNRTGYGNTTGQGNSFFGDRVGELNTTGMANSFVGQSAGFHNRTGNNNTVIGSFANVASDDLSYATAIGSGASVNASNTVVLGRSADTVQVPGGLNVAGTFGANILDAGTQFNIAGMRVLATSGLYNDGFYNFPASNTFLGDSSGLNTIPNPTPSSAAGKLNTFVGASAGRLNATGFGNSFVGGGSGANNTTGFFNAFFGAFAGEGNTTGIQNVFVGSEAGQGNTTGAGNTFIGRAAGLGNQTGGLNAFFGATAGFSNGSGGNNTFLGAGSGINNHDGSRNTYVGSSAGTESFAARNSTMVGFAANFADITSNLNFAAAIGSHSRVNSSDTIVIGKVAGTYDGVARPADTVQIPGTLNVGGAFGANVLNAVSQFNLNGQRILTTQGQNNVYVGISAGTNNTSGDGNSFFGQHAGAANSTGAANSFFGTSAGEANTTGQFNSFFGLFAGQVNTTSGGNSFFGSCAGCSSTGGSNSFFGQSAGSQNTTGASNTFIGTFAGDTNTTGSNNIVIGRSADVGANDLTNATAIGFRALVTQSDSLVLGGITGTNSGGIDTNVGIGTTAPKTKLHLKSGKIYVEANGQGVVLKAPGGACFELTVTDAGALTTTPVACP